MLLKKGIIRIWLESVYGFFKLLLLKILDLTSVLPLRLRYAFTDVLSGMAFLLLGSKRRAVRYNLSLVLKRPPALRDIWMVFREYGRYWAEFPGLSSFWSTMPRVYEGDLFPPHDKRFLGLTFHIGNFEIFGHELHDRFGSYFHVIAERLKPQKLADYFRDKRRENHIETISHDDARGILRVLKRGETLGIVCDRIISGKGVKANLFGRQVSLPLNIVSHALDSGVPVYIAYCVKDDGKLKIISRRIDGSQGVQCALEKISAALEDAVRLYPHQWHVLSPLKCFSRAQAVRQ
ncbi:MAG: lysophospholipid acyltransferase family protein [Chitinispirillaceae bacterium]